MVILWVALLVIFIITEVLTVSLVSVWFAAGALAATVCALLGGEVWLQAVLFFAVSGVMLFLLRPVAKKHFTPKLTRTNVDAVVGSTGKVTLCIDNDAASGQVKLGAMEWTARSTSGAVIEEGTRIRVDKIEGVKAFVSPVEVKTEV